MIQSLLFYGFGFVSALLVALLIAPAFWRRAVRLTERRVQATIPLTMNEIQAEKDALRAGFAMATRRLEMKVESLKDRVAGQMVESATVISSAMGTRRLAHRKCVAIGNSSSQPTSSRAARAHELRNMDGAPVSLNGG